MKSSETDNRKIQSAGNLQWRLYAPVGEKGNKSSKSSQGGNLEALHIPDHFTNFREVHEREIYGT